MFHVKHDEVQFTDAEREEQRAFNDGLERLIATQPSVHTVPPEVSRQARDEGRSIWPAPERLPQAREVEVPGRGGTVRLRELVPEAVDGVYLHIHGGGWVLGAADQQDVLLWRLATQARVAVLSVEYRLAPEHPYPAGPDDCEDAAAWLVAHARERYGTERLVIGGESAGAHLAAVTLLRLRDRHGLAQGGFAGANLVFGAFDMSMTPSQRRWGDRNLVLSTSIIEWFGDCFLPGRDLESRRDPDISPLYADLADLPPARFTVGTLDPLLDDSLFMAARWRAAGNIAELEVHPEAVHGFTAFPLPTSRAAFAGAVAFIHAAVAPPA